MPNDDIPMCQEPDCHRRHYARGWCEKHYRRHLRRGETSDLQRLDTCSIAECDNPHDARGYCHGHYQRWQHHGDVRDDQPLRERGVQRECDVEDCVRRAEARGWCGSHYDRWRRTGDVLPDVPLGAMPRPPVPRRSRGWRSGGYRYVPVDETEQHLTDGAAYAAEHRLLMARQLGRPLHDDENVHHRNGDRSDNRLENLELWTTGQPAGQRVSDRVIDALRTLRRYAPHLLTETPKPSSPCHRM